MDIPCSLSVTHRLITSEVLMICEDYPAQLVRIFKVLPLI